MDALMPDVLKSQFEGSGSYNRILLYLDCEEEGESAITMLSEVREAVDGVYGRRSITCSATQPPRPT